MPFEESLSILKILRMLFTENGNDFIKILDKQFVGKIVLLANGCRRPAVRTNILTLGRNHVKFFHVFTDAIVVKTILSLRFSINIGVHHLTIKIFLMAFSSKIKIATIVTKTNIIAVGILPSPILRSQFAIHRVFIRNILAVVILECPVENITSR